MNSLPDELRRIIISFFDVETLLIFAAASRHYRQTFMRAALSMKNRITDDYKLVPSSLLNHVPDAVFLDAEATSRLNPALIRIRGRVTDDEFISLVGTVTDRTFEVRMHGAPSWAQFEHLFDRCTRMGMVLHIFIRGLDSCPILEYASVMVRSEEDVVASEEEKLPYWQGLQQLYQAACFRLPEWSDPSKGMGT